MLTDILSLKLQNVLNIQWFITSRVVPNSSRTLRQKDEKY